MCRRCPESKPRLSHPSAPIHCSTSRGSGPARPSPAPRRTRAWPPRKRAAAEPLRREFAVATRATASRHARGARCRTLAQTRQHCRRSQRATRGTGRRAWCERHLVEVPPEFLEVSSSTPCRRRGFATFNTAGRQQPTGDGGTNTLNTAGRQQPRATAGQMPQIVSAAQMLLAQNYLAKKHRHRRDLRRRLRAVAALRRRALFVAVLAYASALVVSSRDASLRPPSLFSPPSVLPCAAAKQNRSKSPRLRGSHEYDGPRRRTRRRNTRQP